LASDVGVAWGTRYNHQWSPSKQHGGYAASGARGGAAFLLWADEFNAWSELANNSWLKHVWQVQQEYELNIHHDVPTLKLQATDDHFLMGAHLPGG
jgi:hypothetical protein